MAATIHPRPFAPPRAATLAGGFMPWLRSHRAALAMAGVLSFAVAAHFFVGAGSVMRAPALGTVAVWALWCTAFGLLLWCSLIVVGYALLRLDASRAFARRAATLLGACIAAACADLGSAGRASILLEQGVIPSTRSMLLYAFAYCAVAALLYFALLQRSRVHEDAAVRLAAAQVAQRQARQRLAQAGLQELQARVDPQLLFEMLDAVRHCYENDPARAERLLDELIAFLRASLPRLREVSSSLAREAELARTYAQLRALAGDGDVSLTLHIDADAVGARFPPGVLLPLLADALRRGPARCCLSATRANDCCRVVLQLPARPPDAVLGRIERMLADLHGECARLRVRGAAGAAAVELELPHEIA